MKLSILVLAAVTVAFFQSRRESPPTADPLIEFAYTDGRAVGQDSLPQLQQCGYYLLIRGTVGHSGGFRPGASVQRLGDTVAVNVSPYRAYYWDTRDWRRADWTLRVAGLEARVYHVTVAVGGVVRVREEAKLTFQRESCAA